MKKTICLNMIVKNENHVIRRSLGSLKHLIDYWVIVDTGSTDGTQDTIREFLRDIPGDLHERPWVNFGHNRNEALALARGKADYFLFIDADDRFIFSDSFVMPDLDMDYYLVVQNHKLAPGEKEPRLHNIVPFLIKDLPYINWRGALHEVLVSKVPMTSCTIPGVFNEYIKDGARSKDPNLHDNDIVLLEQELEKEPENSRTLYFLAQYYKDKNDFPTSLKYFKKMAAFGKRADEVHMALYQVGSIQQMLDISPEIVIKSLSKAHLFRPIRAEALFQLAGFFIQKENYWLGYLVAKYAVNIPFPNIDQSTDMLGIDPWLYECGLALQFIVCAHYIGEHEKARLAAQKVLKSPKLPPDQRQYILKLVATAAET